MKDVLEKFIGKHRAQLDSLEPGDRNWHAIKSRLFGAREVSLWQSVRVWRAAAILLLGLSGFLFFKGQKSDPRQAVLQQDFRDVETYYAAQISEKVAFLSDDELFADDSFTQDLQKLEAMYAMLAEQMKRRPTEEVKDALVLNMLVRIDLLNQQIQKVEETRKKRDATSSI